VFTAEVTDEFILGLDVLWAYDASVDLGRHLLRLGQEVTLYRSGAQSTSSRLSPVCDEVIPARCEKLVMVTLETPLRAANVLFEPSQKSSLDVVYVARRLVQARPRVPVRIMNVTNRDQGLSEAITIGYGESEEWATATNVSVRESQALEKLIADCQDNFEIMSGD